MGLKHILLPSDITDDEIDHAYNRFRASILWKIYHSRKLTLDADVTEVESTSTFNPKLYYKDKSTIKACNRVSISHPIQRVLSDLHTDLENYKRNNKPRTKTNLEIKTILQIIKDYPSIVFKAADKNLGLVALDIEHYDKIVMEHLDNTENYEFITDHIGETRQLLISLTNTFKEFRSSNYFYKNERQLMLAERRFTFPKFHVLPKLHKAGTVKGRPIAGAVNWITTPIAKCAAVRLDRHLNLSENNILKNSFDLVKILETFNTSTNKPTGPIWIITADVSALYPNIKLPLLYRIIERLDNSILPLVKFVCDNSYITYRDKIYKQTNGIAMGANCSVQLANIYLDSLIDKNLNSQPNIALYQRYIDDLIIFWEGDLKDWYTIEERFKSYMGMTIEFTKPSHSAIFLDINIRYDNTLKTFHTSIYQKELNKYSYITPASYHVPHMFKGFIKGELTRYARLSTDAFSYVITKNLFFQRLLDRGYAITFLQPIFRKHHWHLRYLERNRPDKAIIPWVIPYSLRTNHQKLAQIWRQYETKLQDMLPDSTILTAFQKRNTIGQLLTSSDLSNAQRSFVNSDIPITTGQENQTTNKRPIIRNAFDIMMKRRRITEEPAINSQKPGPNDTAKLQDSHNQGSSPPIKLTGLAKFYKSINRLSK